MSLRIATVARISLASTLAGAAWLCASAAMAEIELSFYGGLQTSPHSEVSVFDDSVVPDLDFTAGWEGRSFDWPPYRGYRATWWPSDTLGFGLDLNQAKVYADPATLAATGYDALEFSDGLNIITLNAYRSWEGALGAVSPYVGGGLGVSFPHVELSVAGAETSGYQFTGPAVTWIAGASLPINDRWSVFGEYKGSYSVNAADLDGGGTLETNIITNALNLGVSFNF